MLKPIITLILMLVVVSPAAADSPIVEPLDVRTESAPPPAWVFEVDDSGCIAGDRIPYRLAWTNHSDEAVRVPADLLKRVQAYGRRRTVGDIQPTVYISGAEIKKPAATRPAIIVPPHQSIQRIGSLGDFLPDCTDGCLPGDYELKLSGDGEALTSGLDPATDGPSNATIEAANLKWTATIPPERPAPAIGVPFGLGLEATLSRVGGTGKAKRSTVRLTVKNTLAEPVYFPPKDAVTAHWNGGWDDGDKTGGFAMAGSFAKSPAWGPDVATLVAPGATWKLDLVVTDLEHTVDHLWVQLQVHTAAAFRPSREGKTPFFALVSGAVGSRVQLW